MNRRLLAAAAALAVDRVVGEPPTPVHPVAAFGRLMGVVEGCCYQPRRGRGAVYAAIGVGAAAAVGRAVPSTVLTTTVAVAGRSLGEAATAVGAALEVGDLDTARHLLPTLVGRDPSALGPTELARAVVESVAENTVDAVVAPALWAGVGGSVGALGYRAVNTMDAMVGHRSERYRRFGTPAARLDDVANWVPARVTAVLVAAVRPRAARAVWRAVRDDAGGHPSPNSGVAEAAFAAALGVQLGGTSRYGDRTEVRPLLGTGRPASGPDIAAAVRLSRDCTIALGVVLVAIAVTPALLPARSNVPTGDER